MAMFDPRMASAAMQLPSAALGRIDPRALQAMTGQANIMQQLAQSNYGRSQIAPGTASYYRNPTPAGHGQQGMAAAPGAPRSVPQQQQPLGGGNIPGSYGNDPTWGQNVRVAPPQQQPGGFDMSAIARAMGYPGGGLPVAQPARPNFPQQPQQPPTNYALPQGNSMNSAVGLGPQTAPPRTTTGVGMPASHPAMQGFAGMDLASLMASRGGQQSLPTGQPVAMPQPAMAQPAGGGQSPAPSAGAASAPQPQQQTPPQAPQVQSQAMQQAPQLPPGRTPDQQAMLDAAIQRQIKQLGADPRYTAAYMNMMRPMAGPQSLGAAGYRF